MKLKSAAAVELGKRRWVNKTKEERRAHARYMALCRWGSKYRENLRSASK